MIYIIDICAAFGAREAGGGNRNLCPLQFMTVGPLGKRTTLISYKGLKFSFEQSATVDSMG
jgi:hypothetical protein